MLKLNITRVAKARGIERVFTFLRKNGISHNVAGRLVSGKSLSISYKHLELLCTIFNCTPHDLFEWTSDTKQKNTSSHPLHSLSKDSPPANFKELLYSLPISKLNDIARIISEKK